MEEEKQYLNTFAVISFEKENENTTLKYEYFLDSNIIIDDNDIEQEESHDDDNLYDKNFWIVKSKDDKLKKVSIDTINEYDIDNIFLGPFYSEEALDFYIIKNDIIVDN